MAKNPYMKIYPSTGDGRITMDGGLNSNFPRSLLPDNETPDCLNVIFRDGSCETRGGSSKLNTAAFGSFAADGLYTRKANDGSETMVVFANGTGFDLQATSFITIGSAQSVFTAGNRVCAAQYENHLFVGDGQAIPYKYDGVEFTRHGVYPPVATHTAATNSNGTITGDYRYKITYVNSLAVESDVGPVNTTFAASSEEILVSSIPVAPVSWGVSSRRVYRTETSGTAFKLHSTINDNTTTSLVDNKSDSELTTAAPTDQGVPPSYEAIAYTQDRLFFLDPANPNYIWYSELGNPYVVKAENFKLIGDNSADVSRGVVAYNNGIIVTGDETMSFIYMPNTTDTNWVTVIMRVPYGSKSPFSLIPFQDRLLFPATERGIFAGFGSIVGNAIEPSATFLTVLTAGGQLQSKKIEDQMFLIQQAYLKNISAIQFKNQVYFSVTYGTTQTTNNRVYVLNYDVDNLSKVQRFAWAPWTGLAISQFTTYDGKLYGASSLEDGFVYELNTDTYQDESTAINSYYWTKEFTGFKGDENYMKDFRYLNFLAETSGNYKMDVLARVDSDSGEGNKHVIDLNPDTNTWNSMIWGVQTWGAAGVEKDFRVFLGKRRGKRIQFKFTNQNTAGQKFKCNWLKYAYNRKGFR